MDAWSTFGTDTQGLYIFARNSGLTISTDRDKTREAL